MATLTCSNCGKRIPEKGKVCPYCGADKTHDKHRELADQRARRRGIAGLAVGAAILGTVVALLGANVFGVLLAAAIGAPTGYVIAHTTRRGLAGITWRRVDDP
jgi:hypothetical protein